MRLRLFLLAIWVTAAFLLAVLWAARIDAGDWERRQSAVTFEDRNGLLLGTVLPADRERAVSVPLERISPWFTRAIIATEDARFYHHPGIDPFAGARAARELLANGRPLSGASTITMQLARMRFGIPSTARGKLLELWLAFRLEAGSTKAAILQAYANRLPMGSNIYGVEAAAQIYFGEPAADLDLAQSALLAAIPNDPERLNPRTHWHALRERQGYVLQRMVATGTIDALQARRAQAEQLHLHAQTRGILAGAHVLFSLAAAVRPQTSVVRTTLDRPLQAFVETQLRALLATLAARNVHQGAALVIDNRTGDVLAYVGSADYFDDQNHGRNDGVRALRQPGSALKPFLYELALEGGIIAPNTILADVPTTYAIPGGKLYAPADYSNAYAGPVRVRVALANSLNVPAVRVLAQTGTESFLDRLHDLGFAHLQKSAEYYGLGLTLGGGEVSLWELAHAYLTLARNGQAIPLRTVISRSLPESQQVGSPDMWRLITDMLSDSHARAHSFGASSILDLPFPTAVKTGTSSDFRDTWTVGYSRDFTAGVWVGNFEGTPMRRVSGVTGAAPLWNRIMLRVHELHEPMPFERPRGFLRRTICTTTGWRPQPGCPATVSEYLLPNQLAEYARPHDVAFPRSYDEWLSVQGSPATTRSDVRILFPHAGDAFVLNASSNDAVQVAPAQAIRFMVRTLHNARVTWKLNDTVIALNAGDTLMWPLAPGHWRLEAITAARSDSVSFDVVRGKRQMRRGFSI